MFKETGQNGFWWKCFLAAIIVKQVVSTIVKKKDDPGSL